MKHLRKNKKRKKKKRRRLSAPEIVRNRVVKLGPGGERVIVGNQNQEKMSKILLEFAEPLLEATDDGYKAISFAVLAWNTAILTRGIWKRYFYRRRMIKKDSMGLGKMEAIAYRKIMSSFIKRKERLFPKNRRCIIDFELSYTGNDRRLFVISTPDEDQYKALSLKGKRAQD